MSAKACGWTQDRTAVHCDLKGGGTCDFQVRAGTGACISPDGGDVHIIFGSDSRGP